MGSAAIPRSLPVSQALESPPEPEVVTRHKKELLDANLVRTALAPSDHGDVQINPDGSITIEAVDLKQAQAEAEQLSKKVGRTIDVRLVDEQSPYVEVTMLDKSSLRQAEAVVRREMKAAGLS